MALHLVPVAVKHELAVLEREEIPIFSVVVHVALEEDDVMGTRSERATQPSPKRGVTVAPRRDDRETEDQELHARWLVELAAMRDRINAMRQRIAAADPRLAYIGRQFGMFSMLPLTKEQVLKLRTDHAIYMADSGRFNVVGMGDGQIDRFTSAVIEAMDS